jgi:LPS O-antigen subunit length determinant protein (WzzB/FepE family)
LTLEDEILNLQIKKYDIVNKTIPNLQRDKNNLLNVTIKDLQDQIKTIINIDIKNLQRSKENLLDDQIRKIQYALDVTLRNKKLDLTEQIKKAQYNMSSLNVQNSKLVGEYVVYDYPVKPKKKLIVIVAFITGLILSIFLVFFLEFIRAEKKEDD